MVRWMFESSMRLMFIAFIAVIVSSCGGMKNKLLRPDDSASITAPPAATSLNWSQSSPHNSVAVTATWVKSTSPSIDSQAIQFFADGACTSPSGAPTVLSASAQTRNFTGSDGVTYSFRIATINAGGVEKLSPCSPPMTITLIGGNSAPAIAAASCTSNSINEDTAYSCSPTLVEPDTADIQTWTLTGANTCAWATINASSGAISGTPNDDQVGTCSIVFKTNDGAIDSNTVTIPVTVRNVVPTLSIADTAIAEDAPATVIRSHADVQASDEGFGVYALLVATAPRCSDNGALSIDATTGAVTYQPTANYNGTCNVKVGFDDGNAGGTVSDEFAVTVSGSNDVPVASALCATTGTEDIAYTCSPTVADSDNGTHTWAFAPANTCAWASINSTNGAVTGTPNDDQVGSCVLAFKANDGAADSNIVSTTVSIANVAPTLVIANAPAINYASAAVEIRNDATVQASDEGFGSYSLDAATTTAPKCSDNGSVTINATSGAVTFDPIDTYSGTCNVKVVFDDGNAGGIVSDEFTANVSAQSNVAPVISATCATTGTEDLAYSCSPSVSDGNAGDTQTWSLTGANTCAWVSINSGTGAISGTPNDDQVGSCTLAFKSNDGTLDSNILSYTVTVANVMPTLTIADTTIVEDAAATVIRNDAAVEASDEGFGTYSLAIASGTKCSDNGAVSINGTDGDVTYTPAANFAGACNIAVQFDDGNTGGTVTDEFTVTVSGSNDAPVIAATCAAAGIQDSAYSCLPSITDSDSVSFTWSFTASDTCAWDSINATTGAIGGTPNDDQVGTCTIAFKANDGTADSNEITVSVTVSNIAPTLVITDAAAIAEDAVASVIRDDAAVQASEEGYGTYSLVAATGTKCSDNGTVTIDASTGAVTYAPTANYNGSCNVNVQFSDGNGGVAADEFSVAVNAANDAPVLSQTCAVSIAQDSAYSCSPSATDVDGSVTYSFSANTCAWASIDGSSGAITGTPNDDQVGGCSFTILASDGALTDSEVVNVTVTNVAPILTIADAAAISEDAAATIVRNDAAVQASEEGYGTYSIQAATAPDCAVAAQGSVSIDSATGAVTYTPASNYNGTCNIKVGFADGNGGSASDEFAVTVNAVNDAPVASATCATTISEDSAYSCSPSVVDPDGPSATWSFDATDDCAWDTINSGTGAIGGTPNDNQVGTCTIAFKVSDGTATSNVITTSITVTNVAPTLTIVDTSVAEDAAATVIRADGDVEASDEGFGTYSLAVASGTKCSDNGSVSIDATEGSVTYTPSANYAGVCNINVQFDDGNSGIVSDEFAVTVNGSNDTPSLSLSCTSPQNEDVAVSCSATVTDPDDVSFTYSTTAAHTCGWVSVSGAGVFSGSPDDDDVGTCVIAVKVNDGDIDSNEATASITVNNVVPTLTIADAGTINYGSAAVVVRNDAAVQASDEGFGTYSLAATTGTKCSDNGAVSINSASGAVTYDPDDTYSGTCNINVSFDDGNGGTVSDEFAVTVDSNPNQAPVISATCSTSATEDTAYSCSPSVSDANAGDTQTWSFTGGNTCAWASINSGSGAISGTPSDDQVGSCTLAFRSNDGTVDSNILSYTVAVANVAPTLSIADVTISEDAASAVIRNDAAVEASDEGFGTYSLDNAGATAPKCSDNGTLSLSGTDGDVTFQPTANYSGVCNIKITFDDGNAGGTVSDEFAVTVSAVNDAPIITASCGASVAEDSAYSCSPSVSDADSGNTQTWSFDAANDCAWASINSGTGAISGTPNDSHVGTCTLAFKSNDATIDSNVLSYTVTVTNVAPTLMIADAADISEDAAATVIRNDAAVEASDEGYGTYTLIAATAPACGSNGTVSISATDGDVTYTPAANYAGTCNVKVQFDDGNGGIVSDEFAITVTPVNDIPVISASCATSLNHGSAYSCTPSVTDPDDASQTWSFTASDDCAWDTINSSSGAIGGTPNDDQVGTCTIAFKANDGDSDSNELSVSVTVNNVTPTLTIADAAALAEDAANTEIRADADVQASDEGYGVYSLLAATAPACSSSGSVTIDSSTGAVSFDPNDNYNGTCNIKVQFDDQNASSNTASDEFAITVSSTNDAPVLALGTCSASVTQNEDVAFACTPSVTDPDDVAFTFSTTANTCAWLSINSSTGELSGTPNDNQVGTCSATFKANDGDVDSGTQTVSFTIDNVAPTLTIANASAISEDAAATEIRNNAAVAASDEGYGTYTLVAATGTKCSDNGTVSIDGSTGAVTYTPALNYNGTCNIDVQFDDGNTVNNTVAAQFSITVNAANDAPTITATCSTSATQGTAYSCAPSVSDVDDASGFTWAFDATDTCGWDAIDSSTGAISGTPNDDQVGTCTLAFKVTDTGSAASGVSSFSITVSNAAPTLTIADAAAINEDAAATVVRADADVQSNEEGYGTYSLIAATGTKCSDNGTVTINSSNGAVTYTPATNYNGTCNINVEFNDGNASSNLVSDEFAVTVNAVNDVPTISQSCATTIADGGSYSCSPTGSDAEGSALTWNLDASNTCSWASFSGSTVSGTAAGADCTLAFKVYDGSAYSTVASVNIDITSASGCTGSCFTGVTGNFDSTVDDKLTSGYDATIHFEYTGAPITTDVEYDLWNVTDGIDANPAYTALLELQPGSGTLQFNNLAAGKTYSVSMAPMNNSGTFTFTVLASPAITASCPTTAIVGLPYSCTPSATNPNSGTLVWSAEYGGSNCPWHTINSSTGVVGGTPTTVPTTNSCVVSFKVSDGTATSLPYNQWVSVTQPWIWIKGSNTLDPVGVYGTITVEDANNKPGGRAYASASKSGSYVYLFGGNGVGASGSPTNINDLWRYNPTTNAWTHMKGATSTGAAGVWGTEGTEASGNTPSGRAGAGMNSHLVDSTGKMWIYGGLGKPSDNTSALPLGDLWRYNPSTNNWTFMGGASTQKSVSVFGTVLVAAAGNKPSGRNYHGMVVNANNNKIYIFGGSGYGTSCSMICIPGPIGDFWEYDISTDMFRWLRSSNSGSAANGVYGTKGTPATTNYPGSRQFPAMWTDNDNNVWMFGGSGRPASGGSDTELNDMWKYDTSTNMWTWIGGSNAGNNAGTYGTKGTGNVNNIPPARDAATFWKDSSGNFWLYGGYGIGGAQHSDLWKFNPTTLEWTWVDGPNTTGQAVNYGTMGTAAATNTPGKRDGGLGWSDGGIHYVFGGANPNMLGDLWQYGLPASPPVITASCSATGTQSSAYSCSPSATNPNSGTLAWSLDAANTCGWASINTSSGAVSGTPNDDNVGSCTLAFKVSDGSLTSSVYSVSVAVANVAPTLTIGNVIDLPKGSGPTLIRADAQVQASDEGFGTYTLPAATAPRCSDNGTVTINSTNGAVTYDPANTYDGTCNISVQFDDGNASNNTVVASFTVEVDPALNAPATITATCSVDAFDNSAYSCTPSYTDPQNDTQTWSFDGGNTCTWATINSSTGVIGGTPDDDDVGLCVLAFHAYDGQSYSNTISEGITVNNVTPTLSITAASLAEDSLAVVIRSDAQVQSNDEGHGTYSLETSTGTRCGDNGTLSIDTANGAITYTPTTNYNGTCTIGVKFTDTGALSVTTQFNVTVTPVNDAPVISATCATSVNINATYSCSPTATDVDGTSTFTWSFVSPTDTCSWDTINASTGAIGGTAPASAESCVIAFKANDGTADSATYSVTVTVIADQSMGAGTDIRQASGFEFGTGSDGEGWTVGSGTWGTQHAATSAQKATGRFALITNGSLGNLNRVLDSVVGQVSVMMRVRWDANPTADKIISELHPFNGANRGLFTTLTLTTSGQLKLDRGGVNVITTGLTTGTWYTVQVLVSGVSATATHNLRVFDNVGTVKLFDNTFTSSNTGGAATAGAYFVLSSNAAMYFDDVIITGGDVVNSKTRIYNGYPSSNILTGWTTNNSYTFVDDLMDSNGPDAIGWASASAVNQSAGITHTMPAGATILGVGKTIRHVKTGGGGAGLANFFWEEDVSGGTSTDSTALCVSTTASTYHGVWTTPGYPPYAYAWSEAILNALEVGVKNINGKGCEIHAIGISVVAKP